MELIIFILMAILFWFIIENKKIQKNFNTKLMQIEDKIAANEKILKERPAEEYLKEVSHSYDNNNQWMGYEFIIELSSEHKVIECMSSEGELIQIKHIFNIAQYDTSINKELGAYMNVARSKAEIYNDNYFSDSRSKSIDLNSSIETANLSRKYRVQKKL